jgi:hypothetical protein
MRHHGVEAWLGRGEFVSPVGRRLVAVCRLAAASASGPGDCGLSPWCRHRFIREEVAAQRAARQAASDHPSLVVIGRGGRVATEYPDRHFGDTSTRTMPRRELRYF